MSGLSWFGVELDGELAVRPTTSQAQPEPKRLAPPSVKRLLELVGDRRTSSVIASASVARRVAAAVRAHDLPEERVVRVAAAVVADGRPHVLGDQSRGRRSSRSSGRARLRCPSSAALRLSTYAWWCLPWWISIVRASMCGSRRCVVVGQFRKLERHADLLCGCLEDSRIDRAWPRCSCSAIRKSRSSSTPPAASPR